MKRYFGDTCFFLALLNEADDAHDRATNLMDGFRGQIITTKWVLAELANALAAPLSRMKCAAYIRFLQADSDVEIVGMKRRSSSAASVSTSSAETRNGP